MAQKTTPKDVTVTLYAEDSFEIDQDGNEIAAESATTVFGTEESVFSAEYFNAGKLGIKPSCMVKVNSDEYAGQKYLSVNDGRRLSIYRTYDLGEKIELYCTERTGEQWEIGKKS